MDAELIIVGGGPAGMMAGLLFARAGVRTLVLEKHGDFLRDFRGDTVHPSTLALFAELGLLDALLARPHDRAERLSAMVGGKSYTVADFSRLTGAPGFTALMPQWEFLDFVHRAASAYPAFGLRMNCAATGLVTDAGGRVTGVETADGTRLSARLVIAADGRGSVLRDAAALPRRTLGAPMDVFWFRVPKPREAGNRTTFVMTPGHITALIDRGDYWQCAYVFAKGGADAIRARGLPAFRAEVAAAAPLLGDAVAVLTSWDDVKLLTVTLDRLQRWHRPGLLAIGDAAHAMSPVGGVGINLAIQDAVAAANILAGPMAAGGDVEPLLGRIEARRRWPVTVVQWLQGVMQARVIGAVLARDASRPFAAPLALRIVARWPWLQQWPARLVGLGIRREHIRSPVA